MKKLLARIQSFLALFFVNLAAWNNEHVKPAIKAVNDIKRALAGPAADVIVNVIPGDLDNRLLDWLRTHLSKGISVLEISSQIAAAPTLEEKIVLLVEYLKSVSPSLRKGVYLRLASEIAASSGGQQKVKGIAVDLLVQTQYTREASGVDVNKIALLPEEFGR